MFIAFEGIDGSGKTTQLNLLYKYLSEKFQCVLTDEPSKGPIGLLIRKILKGRKSFDSLAIQLLFCADRAHHVKTEILPALKKNKIIITDRYALSTVAYGAASGLDQKMLLDINSEFPTPDATFIVNTDPSVAMERMHLRSKKFLQQHPLIHYMTPEHDDTQLQKTELFEKLEFLSKTAVVYRELASVYKNCFLIDGSKDIEDIQHSIIEIVEKIINKSHPAPIV